jgi:hypothetical protein
VPSKPPRGRSPRSPCRARGRRHAFAKSQVPPLLPPGVGGCLPHFESRRDGARQVSDFSSLGESVVRGYSAGPLPELQSDLPERIEDAATLPGMPIEGDADSTTGGRGAAMRPRLTRAGCPDVCASSALPHQPGRLPRVWGAPVEHLRVCYTEVARGRRPSGRPSTAQGLCARLPLSERLASPPSDHPQLRSVYGMRMS